MFVIVPISSQSLSDMRTHIWLLHFIKFLTVCHPSYGFIYLISTEVSLRTEYIMQIPFFFQKHPSSVWALKLKFKWMRQCVGENRFCIYRNAQCSLFMVLFVFGITCACCCVWVFSLMDKDRDTQSDTQFYSCCNLHSIKYNKLT